MSFKILIDEDRCVGCNICVVICPQNALPLVYEGSDEKPLLVVKNGKAQLVDPSLCNGCGVCVENCPYQAIRIEFP